MSNKSEQFKIKFEKIIGIWKHAGKVRKIELLITTEANSIILLQFVLRAVVLLFTGTKNVIFDCQQTFQCFSFFYV